MYCLFRLCLFFCNDTSTACIYTFCLTLALHAVLPIVLLVPGVAAGGGGPVLVHGVLVPACAGPGHDQRDDGEQHDGSDGDGDLHGPPLPNDRSGMLAPCGGRGGPWWHVWRRCCSRPWPGPHPPRRRRPLRRRRPATSLPGSATRAFRSPRPPSTGAPTPIACGTAWPLPDATT